MLMRRLTRFTSGVLNAIAALPHWIEGERHYASIVAGLQRDELARVAARFAATAEFRDGRKYLRTGLYLRDSIARAIALELHVKPRMKVLDLGSGAGYFVLACRHFGHDAVGFDRPENEYYRIMFRALALPRIEGTIRPMTSVSGLTGSYGLITAFAVTFAGVCGSSTVNEWGAREWRFFLDDMRGRLEPGGRLLLRLNLLPVRGLFDRRCFAFLHEGVPGYDIAILNRREVCLTACNHRP